MESVMVGFFTSPYGLRFAVLVLVSLPMLTACARDRPLSNADR